MRDDDRSYVVIALMFAAISGALVGWVAHMLLVLIRVGQ